MLATIQRGAPSVGSCSFNRSQHDSHEKCLEISYEFTLTKYNNIFIRSAVLVSYSKCRERPTHLRKKYMDYIY